MDSTDPDVLLDLWRTQSEGRPALVNSGAPENWILISCRPNTGRRSEELAQGCFLRADWPALRGLLEGGVEKIHQVVETETHLLGGLVPQLGGDTSERFRLAPLC